jgi:hypothetical protein
MAFRSIGELAGTVLRDAKMAAAATKAQRELGTPAGSTGATTHFMCDVGGIGGGSHREEQYEPPIAQAGEGPASNGIKGRGTNAPASGSSGQYGREGENTPGGKLDLGGSIRLVSCDMRREAPPPNRIPHPALRRSKLIVIEGGRHASTG